MVDGCSIGLKTADILLLLIVNMPFL